MLRRIAYPNRLVDLVPMFNRDPASLSVVMLALLSGVLMAVSHTNRPYGV
jgi:hypothetical protein